MVRGPPRSTQGRSSAASEVYKGQGPGRGATAEGGTAVWARKVFQKRIGNRQTTAFSLKNKCYEIHIIWDLGLYAIGHWIRAEIAVKSWCSRASGAHF